MYFWMPAPAYTMPGHALKDAGKTKKSINKSILKFVDGNLPIINELNTALLGGTNYPILTAVIGTVAGVASLGAGVLFTAGTTALTMANPIQRVLARPDDEIWQVEVIGKTGGDAVYVSAYFLVDPYRNTSRNPYKGWLVHEERWDMLLS